MKKLLSTFALFFLLPLLLHAQPYITAAQADVARLTSPEFHGRGYDHDGHLIAARYIRDSFRAIGLDSLGPWFQTFQLQTRIVTEMPRLVLDGVPLRLGVDYVPSIDGSSGRSDESLQLFDAADGVVIPSRGIDPYDDLDMRDRVAVIDANVAEKIKGDTSIPRVLLSNEVRIFFAARAGARAVILLVDRITYGEIGDTAAVPVFFVRRDLFPNEWKSQKHAVTFQVATGDLSVESNNVIGYLRGTTRPDSTIILCAHYDHLGGIGDSLYFPGANDNASGTAMLLAMARAIKDHPLPYSVLFLAFGGEEPGLYGSRYYVDHPRLPLDRARFLLNFDMTASGNDGVMALGGVDFPEEFSLLQHINDSLGLGELRKRANAPNSDHYFFLARGIHGFYLYPFTGLQPYHHMHDRPVSLEWNVFDKIYRLATELLKRIGS